MQVFCSWYAVVLPVRSHTLQVRDRVLLGTCHQHSVVDLTLEPVARPAQHAPDQTCGMVVIKASNYFTTELSQTYRTLVSLRPLDDSPSLFNLRGF